MGKRVVGVAVAAVATAAVLLAALAVAAAGDSGPKQVLRIGWAADPQTLNPFVDQDDEDFDVWAINWDLPIGFSPKDLSPVPGIVKSWKTTRDRLTTTFKLYPGLKWSDGRPITSADVKYSLDVLGGNGLLFTSYTENVASITTPDPRTVVIETTQPDARVIGGLFIYVLPKHVWGRTPPRKLLGDFRPSFPLVGSGPFIVTAFQHGKILKLDRNPHWRGRRPKFDEIQFIRYGNEDAVERALGTGEIDMIPRNVSAATFSRLGRERDIATVKGPSPSFTELSFNLCSKQNCPQAKFNPGVQDVKVRQALGYAIDRARINDIAARGTSIVAYGLLPQYYKTWYRKPELSYPHDPEKANRILDAAGYAKGPGGIREQGEVKLSFGLYARSEAPYTVQAARLVAEQARKIGVQFKVQVVSTDKLTELTTRKQGGKPAPEFDTFIWNWGGDPYDPSLLLNLLTTKAIGESSDSFYSNPEYDKLYDQQAGEFDVAKRRRIIAKMIAISQRDLPYIELTVDPVLQAYRTDRLTGVRRVCPEPNGDITCDEVGYAPYLTLASVSGGGGGTSPAVWVVGGGAVLGLLVLAVRALRRRGGRGRREEPELEV